MRQSLKASRVTYEPSAAPDAPAPMRHDRDPMFQKHLGDFQIDTTPEDTIPLVGNVDFKAEGLEDGAFEWICWDAEVRYANEDCAVTVRASREAKFTYGNPRIVRKEFAIDLNTVDEAEFLGHLILAAVEKLRRTADTYRVPLRCCPRIEEPGEVPAIPAPAGA